MRLDVIKTIESYKRNGKMNTRYCLTVSDIEIIKDNSPGLYDLISDAFIFGYAQGVKACKAEMKKKVKTEKENLLRVNT